MKIGIVDIITVRFDCVCSVVANSRTTGGVKCAVKTFGERRKSVKNPPKSTRGFHRCKSFFLC